MRISGPEAFNLVERLFSPSGKRQADYPRSRYLYHGFINDLNGEKVDEALVSFMKAPATYTREDLVEINCHSGIMTLKIILELVINAGARIAERGEFTRRAFLNGRIDLSQAESILKIVFARSERAVRIASKNLAGALSEKIRELRQQAISALGSIEAALDFPEEIDEGLDLSGIKNSLFALQDGLEALLRGAKRGLALQEGVATAIIGRPNVGKSSLLNALLRQQRAIVHEMPGTTRDLLEGYLLLDGYSIRLIDTAGIRSSNDPVEQIGIERARRAAEEADLLLFVLDGSSQWSSEDEAIAGLIAPGQKVVLIVNKIDLEQKLGNRRLEKRFPAYQKVNISATNYLGIDNLERTVIELLDRDKLPEDENPLLVSMRHVALVKEALESIRQALGMIDQEPVEFVSMELRRSWEKLGELTGETASEDLLDHIFREFCLGK